jgi:hypothetical protein
MHGIRVSVYSTFWNGIHELYVFWNLVPSSPYPHYGKFRLSYLKLRMLVIVSELPRSPRLRDFQISDGVVI